MTATDKQVRKVMVEIVEHGEIGKAALRAGLDRKTARKYRDAGKLPSELRRPRDWQTREDPFDGDWPEIRARLEAAPELEAKALFEHLVEQHPERYQEGQLRTLQRRIKRWHAQEGPPKEVFFAQEHRPGEAAQTDFTNANELEVTIGGEPFPHLLCHVVLPYSNWQWVTVCRSESILSLRRGLQTALFRIGHVPEFHQTDNSTAATHTIRGEEGRFVSWDEAGKIPSGRRFNERYLEVMRHFGLKPRTTGIGKKEQNGDVEAQNGALKRRLLQYLLLRGSRDFESVPGYEGWIQTTLEKVNRQREKKLTDELAVMRPLSAERLAEYSIEKTRVTIYSTVRIVHNTYSVPARLRGETVEVRVHDERLEVFYSGKLELTVERLLGMHGARIDYRHVIDSLVRKPGAFARYKFRESFFPSLAFRKAYDALHEGALSTWRADLEYLRVLQLAARNMEGDVAAAITLVLEQGRSLTSAAVRELVEPIARPELPPQPVLCVDLESYDDLLERRVS